MSFKAGAFAALGVDWMSWLGFSHADSVEADSCRACDFEFVSMALDVNGVQSAMFSLRQIHDLLTGHQPQTQVSCPQCAVLLDALLEARR